MPANGFDFSYNPPDMGRMHDLGYKFAVSYLHYTGAPDGKCLTKARVKSIFNGGLALVLNMEVTAGRMKGGRKYGVADATDAANSITALGLPKDSVVYFSADFDTSPDDYDKIDEYLRGAASVIGVKRVGVYGEYAVLRHCHSAGTATYFWQTYAWSYGKVFDHNSVYQHQNHVKIANGVVDLDWGYGDFGQIAPPLPDSSTEEPKMEIVDDTPLLIEVHPNTGVYDPITGNKVNTTSDKPFQRVINLRVNGIPNRQSDYYLGRFPDGRDGTNLVAIPIGSADVVATLAVPTTPPPDTTPFDQAYVDKAVKDEKERIAVAVGKTEADRIRSL